MVARVKRKVTGKLTGRAAQRVAIARDVIARVATGQLRATMGVYCATTLAPTVSLHDDAREALGGASCRVCAKGGLLISALVKHNRARLVDISVSSHLDAFDASGARTTEYLSSWFGVRQLDEIEGAFEGRPIGNARMTTLQHVSCHKFRIAHADESDRLLAIMRNIIRNGGRFVMPKRIVAEAKRKIAARAG